MNTEPALDPDRVGKYAITAWGYKQGEAVTLMVHLGHRLGLYQALDGAGPVIVEGCWLHRLRVD